MAKKTAAYDEYLEVRRFQEDLRQRRAARRQMYVLAATLVYVLIIVFIFLLFQPKIFSSLLTNTDQNGRFDSIETKLSLLQGNIDSITDIINKENSSYLSYSFLNNRLMKLESSQRDLYNSVLLKPEDIVTARLLTDKLTLLDSQFVSLKEDFRGLSQLLTQLLWTIVIVPIVGAVGFFIRERFIKKPDLSF